MALRTQIYLNGSQLDLLEDISIPATYSIADVREPDKRTTNFTKTITLPGTNANNILFAHLYDVHTSVATSGTTTFNPNLKSNVLVVIDGSGTFEGYLQLNNITVVNANQYSIEYNCTLFGNLANIFQTLGDLRLNQLVLSPYNHTLTVQNQVNSWSAPVGSGYVYPLIDYGFSNGSSWQVNQLYPSVYLKTLIDAMFNQAGFQYQSNFFNSTFFKRLIVPYNGTAPQLTNAQAQARGFRASRSTTQQINYPATATRHDIIVFNDETTAPNWDTGGVYNNITGTFNVPKSGTYKITAYIDMDLTHYPSTASVSYGTFFGVNSIVTANIYRDYGLGTPYVFVSQGIDYKAGSTAQTYYSSSQPAFIYNSATLTSGTTNCSVTIQLETQQQLNVGNTINIDMIQSKNPVQDLYGGTTLNSTKINVKNTSYFTVQLVDTTIQEGDTIDMAHQLPENVKQTEVLTSVIKAFNLFVDNDKTASNKLIIEPRDDFYTSGVTRDWSAKLDLNSGITITPMGELDNRTYTFKYKEDSDYYNEKYKTTYNETYGYKKVSVTNDFIKSEQETELIFSPTPLADYIGLPDRVIPKIFSVDSNNVPKPKTSNLRLLYYGGIKSTASPYNIVSTSGTTTNYVQSTYGYAGHLDDAFAPTLDLNFGVPRELYFTSNSYTDNNLYNKYWKKYINEITDKDSKLVTGFFKLNATDIAQLSFYDVFYFNSDYFRLNKIYDYDPCHNELTKCEFVKLITYPSFVSDTKAVYGGSGTFNSGDALPNYGNRVSNGNNAVQFNNSLGLNNSISPLTIGCSITGGTLSNISPNCTNVSLINTSGVTVNAGVSNVVCINTSGITVSSSDQLIINGTSVTNPFPQIAGGTYTPTLSNTTNITASTAYSCQYLQVGSTVTVSGRVDIDTTGAGSFELNMSLPISSSFGAVSQCAGTGTSITNGDSPIYIKANLGLGSASLNGNDSDLTNHAHYFTFTYRIL